MAASGNFMTVFNQLEKYSGQGDLAAWLIRFNRCCLLTNKQDDNTKGQIIMLCLAGQALAVAEQLVLERNGAQTFAQVQARLESVFATAAIRERQMKTFETRIQRADETVDDFMLDLVTLFRSANPDAPDREFQKSVKRKFVQGISPALRRALYVFCNDPSSVLVTHQQLLEFARTANLNIVEENAAEVVTFAIDDSSCTPLTPAGTTTPTATVNAEFVQAVANLTTAVNELNSSHRGNWRGRGRDGCGGRGRRRSNQQVASAQVIKCHKCGGENHLARHCLSKN